MCSESPNGDDQEHPSDEADSDQFSDQSQPDEIGEDEPIHSAETAQSITDSDLQTRQQNNDQDIQHNNHASVVVDTENQKKKKCFNPLENWGLVISKPRS